MCPFDKSILYQEDNMDNGYDQNYYRQTYNGYDYGAYPPPQRTNPLGIVSMILGIVSLVFAIVFCCCAPGSNMPFAIAAIVTGILQIKSKTNQNGRGMGLAGLITASVSIVIFAVLAITYIVLCATGTVLENDPSILYDLFDQ